MGCSWFFSEEVKVENDVDRKQFIKGLGTLAAAPALVPFSSKGRRRPNVLFILTDDQPPHTMSGMPKTKAAFSRGLDLTSTAYVAIPLCAPARATIFTGRYPHNHRIVSNRNPNAWAQYLRKAYVRNDLFSLMGAAGYDLGFMGKVMNGYAAVNKTWVHPAVKGDGDLWIAMTGSEEVEKFEVNLNGKLVKPGIAPTTYFANQADTFIRGHAKTGRPWFCYVALHDPHVPFTPKYDHAYDRATYSSPGTEETDLSDKSAWSAARGNATPKVLQKYYEGTMEELVMVDRRTAGLVEALKETGQLDNTLVLFSSDNGFMMGEHGAMLGKSKPYEESARVPFLIIGPGIPSSLEVPPPLVSHADIPVTILDAANNRPNWVEGRSILSYFKKPSSWRKRLLVEMPSLSWYMVREGDTVYMDLPNGEHELYDISQDPYQLESLHRDPGHAETIAHLNQSLSALRSASGIALRAAER
jgi:N-acetylglucosamine-6-sulfatase